MPSTKCTKLYIFYLEKSLALVIHTNDSENSFVSVRVGEREYQMEWFIQVECVLYLIFDICCAHGTFTTPRFVKLK